MSLVLPREKEVEKILNIDGINESLINCILINKEESE